MKHILVLTILLGVLGSATSLNADAPITISVWPAVATVRGTAELKIFIERNDQNRALVWEVDGPDYYRSSSAQLEGADAPRNWRFSVKDLEEGDYQVRAVIKRSNNSEATAQTSMVVVGIRTRP